MACFEDIFFTRRLHDHNMSATPSHRIIAACLAFLWTKFDTSGSLCMVRTNFAIPESSGEQCT